MQKMKFFNSLWQERIQGWLPPCQTFILIDPIIWFLGPGISIKWEKVQYIYWLYHRIHWRWEFSKENRPIFKTKKTFLEAIRTKVSSLVGSRSLTRHLALSASWETSAEYWTVEVLSRVDLIGMPSLFTTTTPSTLLLLQILLRTSSTWGVRLTDPPDLSWSPITTDTDHFLHCGLSEVCFVRPQCKVKALH